MYTSNPSRTTPRRLITVLSSSVRAGQLAAGEDAKEPHPPDARILAAPAPRSERHSAIGTGPGPPQRIYPPLSPPARGSRPQNIRFFAIFPALFRILQFSESIFRCSESVFRCSESMLRFSESMLKFSESIFSFSESIFKFSDDVNNVSKV